MDMGIRFPEQIQFVMILLLSPVTIFKYKTSMQNHLLNRFWLKFMINDITRYFNFLTDFFLALSKTKRSLPSLFH